MDRPYGEGTGNAAFILVTETITESYDSYYYYAIDK